MRPIYPRSLLLVVIAATVIGWPHAGEAQGGPMDIIAAKIRAQGYASIAAFSSNQVACAHDLHFR